jgi:hypothetical protein
MRGHIGKRGKGSGRRARIGDRLYEAAPMGPRRAGNPTANSGIDACYTAATQRGLWLGDDLRRMGFGERQQMDEERRERD